MFYYLVHKNYDEAAKGIFCYDQKIEKGDVVVIPRGMKVGIAEIAEELDAYTAMSNSEEQKIRSILCVIDLTEFKKEIEENIKMLQIEQIMEERMDDIKRIEAYRKIAEKDPSFKELFMEYERLKKDKKSSSVLD